MENKTYHGGVIGWILGGSFIVIGILNFVFVPESLQRSPAWLLTVSGLILIMVFQTKIRFDSKGFSISGPFFISRRIEYDRIIQFHFEYRDRKFPNVPTSVQYRLSSGEWVRFESGLYSARVQRQIAEEFRERVPSLKTAPDLNLAGMEQMLCGLQRVRKIRMFFFLSSALLCIGIWGIQEFRFQQWNMRLERWLPVHAVLQMNNGEKPIRYHYIFRGKKYNGTRLLYNAERYPVNPEKAAVCMIDPENPETSFLTFDIPPVIHFINIFRTRFLLLPGILFLYAFSRGMRSHAGPLDKTTRYMKTFPVRQPDPSTRNAMQRPLLSAGKINTPFVRRYNRFSAFYPSWGFRRFAVFDTQEKCFFYCRFYKSKKILEKRSRDSIPFPATDHLAVCQIERTLSVGIFAVTKDGCCYGLGRIDSIHLSSLDENLVILAEIFGHIPVIFL